MRVPGQAGVALANWRPPPCASFDDIVTEQDPAVRYNSPDDGIHPLRSSMSALTGLQTPALSACLSPRSRAQHNRAQPQLGGLISIRRGAPAAGEGVNRRRPQPSARSTCRRWADQELSLMALRVRDIVDVAAWIRLRSPRRLWRPPDP
jgi:hypothetical protein